MRSDEIGRIVIVREVLRKFVATHSDLDVLANLQVQMRIVKTVGVPQRGDLVTTFHGLPAMDQDFLQMSVQRIDIPNGAAVAEHMTHDDHISPAHLAIARENHNPIADAINRITQISVAAAETVPVFTEMAV